MSAALQQKLSLAEYFNRERLATFKSQFVDGEMFAMAGGTTAHNIIKSNVEGELYSRLKGGRCRTVSSDQRLIVERTGLVTYPDVMIMCGEWQYAAEDDLTVTNPVAIVEVLSPSTERYDRGANFRHYQQVPSLEEYILISQDEAVCERFRRQADGAWGLISFVGLSADLQFTSVKADIPLSAIYAGVTLTEKGV